ncbi:hypothetical protein LGM89_16215 [Burkholderia sp. AU31624]|uniref:hypothetical protein n=1 Tax=Burkholderia sp. AU31624 TaxID=2879629 RepID=UPI001CF55BF7|nr:hypothetical protein [Burkholderia sp. AU31624]MCA8254819.1 hypothetical protein [Burkholderia sp. AU31624]
MIGKPSREKLEATKATLLDELQSAHAQLAAKRGEYSDAILEDGSLTERASALMREAGAIEQRIHGIERTVADANERIANAIEAEQRAKIQVRLKEAADKAKVREEALKAMDKAVVSVAEAWRTLDEANRALAASLPGGLPLDPKVALIHPEEMVGAVKLELAKQGCPFVNSPVLDMSLPHIKETLTEKAERVGAWLQSQLKG